MNTDFMVMNDKHINNEPLTMTSKGIAEFLGKEHKHVLRDFKTMVIEIVGGDEFIAHRITGGLSSIEYIRQNVNTLFPELMDSNDGALSDHPVFKGFRVDTDNRGYTSMITMNKVAARAFSGRFNSRESYKMATYLDYLEDENKKLEMEAITKRVEDKFRIKETAHTNLSHEQCREIYDKMTHAQVQDMFMVLTDKQQADLISRIPLGKLSSNQIGSFCMNIIKKFGTIEDKPSEIAMIDEMKMIPNDFLPEEVEVEMTTPLDFVGNPKDAEFVDPNRNLYTSVWELCRKAPNITPWLYDEKILKNGTAISYPNRKDSYINVHARPFARYKNLGYVVVVKHPNGRIQTMFTDTGVNYLIKRYNKSIKN